VAPASSLPAVWSSVPDFALPLYCGGVCWTLVYDTLYAHQDKADDRKLGLNSSALSIGDELTKPVLLGFSALTLGGIGLAGSELSWPFYAALGAGR
jgi:4-hydroxybenzoate polyprenyltransferase